jgi:hypothetical protein
MRAWHFIGAFAFVPLLALGPIAGCGGSSGGSGFGNDDAGSSSSGGGSGSGNGSSGGGSGSSSGLVGDSGGRSGGGPPLIYAHTDSELYSMDPNTHVLTDIGPFTLTGGGSTPTITDLAVDGAGNVWVNSETAIYGVTLPSSGTGPVNIALHTQLQTGTKFYALGFTPAGTLESGESLIAGDSAGDLYYISPTSNVPQNLGGFGGSWELSGDVVFFSNNGATLGLATIRTCSSSCSTTNDSLAEIDMDAVKAAYTSNTPSSTLLKQVFGSGTGFGDLFGIGAWGNEVYAFSRASSSGSKPAQLVEIGTSGTGTSLMTFPNITSGWSGAGVTTKASITIISQ